jgi:hypothetical protein
MNKNVITEARVLGAEFRLDTGGRLLVRNFEQLPKRLQRRVKGHVPEIRERLAAETPMVMPEEVIAEAELILAYSHFVLSDSDRDEITEKIERINYGLAALRRRTLARQNGEQ